MTVYSLGRIWGPAECLSPQDESEDQQDSGEVSRKLLGTGRIAVQSLGRV